MASRAVAPMGRMTRHRLLGVAACAVVGCAAVVVVSHDYYQAFSFRRDELLCQRSDGSFWADPSQGCGAGEDPRCAEQRECDDSTPVSEGWRHACVWFFFDQEVAPRGHEPFYEGPAPGRGCLGRA